MGGAKARRSFAGDSQAILKRVANPLSILSFALLMGTSGRTGRPRSQVLLPSFAQRLLPEASFAQRLSAQPSSYPPISDTGNVGQSLEVGTAWESALVKKVREPSSVQIQTSSAPASK